MWKSVVMTHLSQVYTHRNTAKSTHLNKVTHTGVKEHTWILAIIHALLWQVIDPSGESPLHVSNFMTRIQEPLAFIPSYMKPWVTELQISTIYSNCGFRNRHCISSADVLFCLWQCKQVKARRCLLEYHMLWQCCIKMLHICIFTWYISLW